MSIPDETVGNAITLWTSGDQKGAVDAIRPFADEDDPAALLLICWFLHQMPDPDWRDGIGYAKRAGKAGNPWAVSYFLGNTAAQPDLHSDAVELVRVSPTAGWPQTDPIGHALNFLGQSDPGNAAAMIKAAAGPWAWPSETSNLRERIAQLDQDASTVSQKRDHVLSEFDASEAELAAERSGLLTRAGGLADLMDNLTNASAQKHFADEAKKYESESVWLWVAGVAVLFLAATAALLPLVLNYFSSDHALHGQSNVSAHLGVTLAFAAVAGVLLARARSRDRARQRNRDLSVALSTMFAYSEQIVDDDEKQRFKHDMGRLVLETFLRQEAAIEEGSRNIISAITDSGAAKPPVAES